MYKYQLVNGKIVAFQKYENDEIVMSACQSGVNTDDNQWLETENEIVQIGVNFYFADDIAGKSQEQILDEQEKNIAEAEALKPTVEDLAEALDILTNIVLGGE